MIESYRFADSVMCVIIILVGQRKSIQRKNKYPTDDHAAAYAVLSGVFHNRPRSGFHARNMPGCDWTRHPLWEKLCSTELYRAVFSRLSRHVHWEGYVSIMVLNFLAQVSPAFTRIPLKC